MGVQELNLNYTVCQSSFSQTEKVLSNEKKFFSESCENWQTD